MDQINVAEILEKGKGACEIVTIGGGILSDKAFTDLLCDYGFEVVEFDGVGTADTYFRVRGARGIVLVNLLNVPAVRAFKELPRDSGKYYDVIMLASEESSRACAEKKDKGLIRDFVSGTKFEREELCQRLIFSIATCHMRFHNVTQEYKKKIAPKYDRSGRLRGACVLLLEDNVAAGNVTREILEEEGATVHWAKSVGEAVARYARDHHDIAISDLMMPGISGAEAIHIVRTVLLGPDTPIIVLSAFPERSIVEDCKQEGVAAFLTKPVMPGILISRLAGILSTKETVSP